MVPKKTKRLRHCRRIVSIFTLPCVGGKQVFGKAPRPHILPVDAVLPGTAVRQVCGEAFFALSGVITRADIERENERPGRRRHRRVGNAHATSRSDHNGNALRAVVCEEENRPDHKRTAGAKSKKKREKTKQYKIAVYSNDYLSFPAALLR